MSSEKKVLTIQTVAERKEAKRLTFADMRYITRGNPRSGGIASVYRATDADTSTQVALKIFRSGDGTDEVIEESFRREVQALSDLSHPNIVRILNSGRDEENGVHFIAMEWIEQDLKTVSETAKFENWNSFFDVIGRGILDGLVFAHSRSTVHRDIKPSNILVAEDGRPVICDFGISKIRNFLAPGVTLAQFASAPYSPTEEDDGSYSYSRDVFGFAALAIATLSKTPIEDNKDLMLALEDAAMDDSVRRLLRRCLSLEHPELRPQNAVVLLGEIERIQPPKPTAPKGIVLFSLTKRVREIVEYDLGLRLEGADRFVERDLDGVCCEEIPVTEERPDQSFRLFGHKYSYTAVRDETSSRLVFVNALEHPQSELEKKREFSCAVDYKFSASSARTTLTAAALEGLCEQLVAYTADQKIRRLEQREQALYKTWLDLLSAQTELEKKRKWRANYQSIAPSGQFIRLSLVAGSETSYLADQDVTIEVAGAGQFKGAVVSTSEDSILIQPSERNRVEAAMLPEPGVVEVDTTKTDVALDKQKSAVDAVRYGRSVNPELGQLILTPEAVPVYQQVPIEFIQGNIDDDKKSAVLAALSGSPLMLVQGPPGTGKTTFITELVLQTLRSNPNARILLTSQTHVALDNSLERIVDSSGNAVRAVRIGNEADVRISASTRKLLLDAKLPEMRRTSLASGREFIEKWSTERGLSLKEIRKAMALERHARLKTRLEEVESSIDSLHPQLADEIRKTLGAEERAELEDMYQGLSQERDDLTRELKESLKDLGTHVDDSDEFKEFAGCSAADLRLWADAYSNKTQLGTQLKKLLQAHAEWESRFGRSREFVAALISSSQVVAGTCLGVMGIPGRHEITYDLCIVDEASIATPTQVLVPMSRARNTVLVGDSKQLSPFQDPDLRTSGLLERYGLTVENQRETLFNRLSEGLPNELKKQLTTQHRMLPAIGDLISDCFYEGKLKSMPRSPKDYLIGAFPRPVTWYSTSRKANRGSRKVGTSFFNDIEIQQVLFLLGRVDFVMKNGRAKGKQISVAVLSGYGEQKKRLNTAIQTRRHEWSSYSDIFVNVVDAFQGREADMVIFSVTRSEVQGLGFLREMERINVALSRAREMLAIVGDHAYCQAAEGAVNPLKDVVDYIRRNPESCVLEELPA